ncbi:ROK family protein [Evansella sp. AB-rgal1]|uniref:ROK family protein n=1 Tax=Evansella sp. AB-rgal1 TaxID=3242696 RepID=UPI00359D6CC0
MEEYIIGIDLGGTNIKGAIFNSKFQTIKETSVLTEASIGPDHVLNRMKRMIEDLLCQAEISINSIYCMGMGIPGLLDPHKGISIFSPNFPGWENIHIVDTMEEYFGFPVFIDNDVRVNLYGEWTFGAGLGYKDIVLITLGTGLGSGIVSDGKVVFGKTYSAGEIGHMNMYRNGRPCRCGSSGCLGRYVSALGMTNTFKEKLEEGRTSIIEKWINNNLDEIEANMISKAYDLGDPLAVEV